MAEFLDTFFYGFDTAIYTFFGSLQCSFMNVIMNFITLFGSAQAFIIYLILGMALCFSKKTRKYGITALFALAIGFLVTNYTIKPWVARPRPYVGLVDTPYWEIYREFYEFAGCHTSADPSFPSGHTTTAFELAVSMSMLLGLEEKKKWPAIPLMIFAFLVGISRIYVMVHYPTDVIVGMVIGTLAGVVAYYLSKALRNFLARRKALKMEALKEPTE